MDSRITRLVKGDHDERAMLLMDGDSTFMREVIDMVMKCHREKRTEEELLELAALSCACDGAIQDLNNKDILFQRKVKILRRHGRDFIHKLLKPMKRHKRIRKDCPVPGCTSLGLLQLSNHLNNVH